MQIKTKNQSVSKGKPRLIGSLRMSSAPQWMSVSKYLHVQTSCCVCVIIDPARLKCAAYMKHSQSQFGLGFGVGRTRNKD